MDLAGDEEDLEQAQGVEAEEVAVAIVAMVPTRDLLTVTNHETTHQAQSTMTMRNMVIMDQEAPVVVAEEDTGADGVDGEDTEDHLPQDHLQDHQVALT